MWRRGEKSRVGLKGERRSHRRQRWLPKKAMLEECGQEGGGVLGKRGILADER